MRRFKSSHQVQRLAETLEKLWTPINQPRLLKFRSRPARGHLAFDPMQPGKSMSVQNLIWARVSAETSVVDFVLHWTSLLGILHFNSTTEFPLGVVP